MLQKASGTATEDKEQNVYFYDKRTKIWTNHDIFEA